MTRALVLTFGALVALVVAVKGFAQDIPLQEPGAKVGHDLVDVIKARVSTHGFVRREIPLPELSTILWAGNGMRTVDAVSAASKAARTVPYSGDDAYVNVRVFTPGGVYLYDPAEKLLKQSSKGDARSLVTVENIETASIMLLFTYDLAKIPPFLSSLPRLFHDFAEGTAGFSAENVMLAAAAYKIGSIVMYNLKPASSFAAAAKLGPNEVPLFIVQLGYLQ
jgi:nitroreductase